MKKLLSVLFLFTTSLSLFAVDPISVVQNPLTSRPALVKAGNSFQIQAKAGSSVSGWGAVLSTPYNSVNLTVSASYSSSQNLWTLTATVPAGTPFELYDLSVTANGVSDKITHAVKVLQEFKNSYYFIHLPDLHMPSVSWIGYYDDANTIPEFKRIADEIEIINPEFVLQTGDIVDNGQSEEQYRIVQDVFNDVNFPMFMTGGNHDLWYNGHTFWQRYINPVMNYSFNYGTHHFSGMEMFDIPSVTFTADQMRWLQADLEQSITSSDNMRSLFYHYDESHQITSDFVDDYQVDLITYGHTHINGANQLGARGAWNLNTSFSMNDNGEYRLIKVADNKIQEFPVIDYKKLNIVYSPANDGTNQAVTAIIQNNNAVRFENGLIKFKVKREATGYSATGGTIEQKISASGFDVYYVSVDIAPNTTQQVVLRTNGSLTNTPPQITSFNPQKYYQVLAGVEMPYVINAADGDGDALSFEWFADDIKIPGATAKTISYAPPREFTGLSELMVKVSDGRNHDTFTWKLEVAEYSDKPVLISPVLSFFPFNEEMTLEWIEPFPMNARLEFGLTPGNYSGSVNENGNSKVTFTPSMQGMGFGKYYCRITDGINHSIPFYIVIESPTAPKMLGPVGNIVDLSPTFSWERVTGVPYYMVICSDREIIILEDPETGDFSIEGANPIWAVLTPENSVPYGIPDPSNTYTSIPSPLVPGQSYWWVVLNCYGNSAELVSPVQSGFSQFTVDLPPPDMDPPLLLSPENNVTRSGDEILFKWQPARNASGYHFYPFKIEDESGIETARAIWEDIISTTDTEYVLDAKKMLVDGRYRWRVSSVAANGVELPSEDRDFTFSAPSATISIYTYDDKGTPVNTGDDVSLPRVGIRYFTLDGIFSSLPLSTDLNGARADYKVSPGTYIFKVEKDGFDSLIDTLTFAESDNKRINFRLSPSKSSVSGSVVDDADASVADVSILAQHTLRSDVQKSGKTDGMGNFNISLIPGPYQISVSKEGYEAPAPLSVSVASGENFDLESKIVIQKNKNKIFGRVLNTSLQPIYGVKVFISKGDLIFEKLTDINGSFSFLVENGTWRITANKTGFVSPAPKTVSVNGGTQLEISPAITLQPNAGIILGHVTDGLRTLAGALIKAIPVSGTPFNVLSDEYGQFSFSLPAGTFSLTAAKENHTFAENVQVTVAAGETVSGVELTLDPAQAFITGKVTTDGYTPLPGVEVSNSGTIATTGDGGFYSLGVDYGTHVITAIKEGFISTPPETISVAAGQTIADVDFILSPNASVIKGRITSSGGAVAGANIQAIGDRTLSTKSDENGYYILNLSAGSWDLTITKTGFSSFTRNNVWVGLGQTVAGINFSLGKNIATVKGSITDNTGSPLRDVQVAVQGSELATKTGSDGSYSLLVEPANYTIEFSKTGYRVTTASTGTLILNQVKTIDKQLGKLASHFSGVIIDKNNNPIGNAEIKASSSGEHFLTTSEIDGTFRLDVSAGVFTISASKSGYQTYTSGSTYNIGSDENKKLGSIKLLPNRGGINGFVQAQSTGDPVISATLVARQVGGITVQTKSGDDGSFAFVDESGDFLLPPGTYQLDASKIGFVSETLTGISVVNSAAATVNATLKQNTGQITGTITSSGSSVEGATITAQQSASGVIATAVSKSTGEYKINGLADGIYKMSVAKAGYTSPGASNASVNTVVDFVLVKNAGRIRGIVKDVETGSPISGVRIYADDSFGNNGTAHTNSAGAFDITGLPQANPYVITVSKSGYKSQASGSINVTTSTTQDFNLEKLYGKISGSIVDADGSPVADVVVSATSGTFIQYDTTGTNGLYQFQKLPAQQYSVKAFKIGFAGDPLEHIVSLWTGNTFLDGNFKMIEARVAEIKIRGPENISNNTTQKYEYSALTSDGREASVDPLWAVDFNAGVEKLTQDGLIDPQNDFVGTLFLQLKDKLTGNDGKKQINVVQALTPGHPAITVADKRGVELILQDSSIVQNVSIKLRRPKFADVRRNSRSFKVVGDVYRFSPSSLPLLKPARLILPIGETAATENLNIGFWDTEWLEWKIIPHIDNLAKHHNTGIAASGATLQADINQLGTFAILAGTEPLGIKDLKVLPNPFSPITGPADISFILTSDQTPTPEVTLKIYNMVGDLVKTLVDAQLKPRGENIIPWDGTTDYGKMAMNGRYVLHLQIKDISGTKEKLQPFVLIK